MEQPSYYAILPANVRYNKALPPMARILYAEITALSNRDGFCSAPNRYFARLYEVDESTVTKWLGALRDQSHITVLITRNEAKQIIGRQIFPTETLPAKMRVPSPQKDQDPPRKNAGTPPRKNAAVNNTSINTTSNNREGALEKFTPPDSEEIKSLFAQKLSTLPNVAGPEFWADWEARKFEEYYAQTNWKVGRAKMKDWRRAVSGWISRGMEHRTYLKPCPTAPNYANNNNNGYEKQQNGIGPNRADLAFARALARSMGEPEQQSPAPATWEQPR